MVISASLPITQVIHLATARFAGIFEIIRWGCRGNRCPGYCAKRCKAAAWFALTIGSPMFRDEGAFILSPLRLVIIARCARFLICFNVSGWTRDILHATGLC
eukprot:11442502-Karenia_brevis.AAC.1